MAIETPAKPNRSHARALQNDERLLDAMEALLNEGANFDDIGVETIIRRAGCSRGAFYRRYESKAAILLDLFAARVSGKMNRNMANALNGQRCKGMSIREIVRGYLSAVMENFTRYRAITMLVGREMRFGNPAEEVMRGDDEMAYDSLDVLLARLFEHKEEIGHPDPEEVIRMVDTCTTLCIRERAYSSPARPIFVPGDVEDEKVLDHLTNIFVDALRVDESKLARGAAVAVSQAESNGS